MSAHHLTPKRGKKHLTIVIGWDRPFGSYYAQVHSNVPDHTAARSTIGRAWATTLRSWRWTLAAILHRPAGDLVWVGTDFGEITDPAVAIAHVAPYAIIPADLHTRLSNDAAREGSRRADRNRNRPATHHPYND